MRNIPVVLGLFRIFGIMKKFLDPSPTTVQQFYNFGVQTKTEETYGEEPRLASNLFALLLLALGCSGGNRQLQSITANSTGMTQFQLTATGIFSASPKTITPLPVAWYVVAANVNYQGGPVAYTLTSQAFSTPCQTGATAVAIAPQSPSAQSSGVIANKIWLDLAVSHTTNSEGGFVASLPVTIFCP